MKSVEQIQAEIAELTLQIRDQSFQEDYTQGRVDERTARKAHLEGPITGAPRSPRSRPAAGAPRPASEQLQSEVADILGGLAPANPEGIYAEAIADKLLTA